MAAFRGGAQKIAFNLYSFGDIVTMVWMVEFHADFDPEFAVLALEVRREILALANLLSLAGPNLRRPHADTLKNARHANMKELRFSAAGGAWRLAYAFDPERKAILLVAGDKAGVNQMRFYRTMIDKADARFASHLENLRNARKGER
jgi:hypothetical protein